MTQRDFERDPAFAPYWRSLPQTVRGAVLTSGKTGDISTVGELMLIAEHFRLEQEKEEKTK